MFPKFNTAVLMLHLDKTDRTICAITDYIKTKISTFSGSQTRYIPTKQINNQQSSKQTYKQTNKQIN